MKRVGKGQMPQGSSACVSTATQRQAQASLVELMVTIKSICLPPTHQALLEAVCVSDSTLD